MLFREELELSSEQWLELLQDNNVFRDEDIILVLEHLEMKLFTYYNGGQKC